MMLDNTPPEKTHDWVIWILCALFLFGNAALAYKIAERKSDVIYVVNPANEVTQMADPRQVRTE